METTMTHIVDVLDRQRKIDRQQISEEAYRLYLNLHPELKLEGVLTLYLDDEISLSRASELLRITVLEFKELLASKGIVRETEGKSAEEMDRKLRDTIAL